MSSSITLDEGSYPRRSPRANQSAAEIRVVVNAGAVVMSISLLLATFRYGSARPSWGERDDQAMLPSAISDAGATMVSINPVATS